MSEFVLLSCRYYCKYKNTEFEFSFPKVQSATLTLHLYSNLVGIGGGNSNAVTMRK